MDLYSNLAELIITCLQNTCYANIMSNKSGSDLIWPDYIKRDHSDCKGRLFSCFSVFSEGIKQLEEQKGVLESESANYASESQKLQQKLQIMTEMYQENELKLHRFGPWEIFIFHSLYFAVSFFIGNSNTNTNNSIISCTLVRMLTVEEKERLQKEEKLNKAGKKISLAAEELNTYRSEQHVSHTYEEVKYDIWNVIKLKEIVTEKGRKHDARWTITKQEVYIIVSFTMSL